MVHFTEFLKNAKIEKFKYDILGDFQTLWASSRTPTATARFARLNPNNTRLRTSFIMSKLRQLK